MIPGLSYIMSMLDAVAGVFRAMTASAADQTSPAAAGGAAAAIKIEAETMSTLAQKIAEAIARQVLTMKATTLDRAPGARPETTAAGAAVGVEAKKKDSGFATLTASLGKMTAASATAFAAVSAGLIGLAAAASPALFQTLTQSAQLLAAVLGRSLVGPITYVSFRIQDLVQWVKRLDPALKASIGWWVAWGAGALGAVAVIGKVTSMITALGPMFTGLRAIMAVPFATPFGLLLAGLAAIAIKSPEAFKPFIDAAKSVGASLSAAFSGGGMQTALSALTGAIASAALPILEMLAVAAKAAADGIQWLTANFGPAGISAVAMGAAVALLVSSMGPWSAVATLATIALSKLSPTLALVTVGLAGFTAAIYLNRAAILANPIGLIITVAIAAAAALRQLSPVLSAVAVGAAAAAVAWKVMTLAMVSTPIGLLAVLASFAAGALAMGSAFGEASINVLMATDKLRGFVAMKEKALSGQELTSEDVKKLLTADESLAMEKAKTKEERIDILEKAKKRIGEENEKAKKPLPQGWEEGLKAAKKEFSPALSNAMESTPFGDVLDWWSGDRGGSGDVTKQPKQVAALSSDVYAPALAAATGSSVSEAAAQIKKMVESIMEEAKKAGVPMGQGTFEKKLEEAIRKEVKDTKVVKQVSTDVIDLAINQEKGVKPAGPEQTRLEKLQAMQTKYAVAFSKEMNPQSMDVSQVRNTIQNIGLGTNAIEQLILEEQRITNREMLQKLWNEVHEMKEKL